jgi:hypothetical protein
MVLALTSYFAPNVAQLGNLPPLICSSMKSKRLYCGLNLLPAMGGNYEG